MPDLIANSVFRHNGKEYHLGEKISPDIPDVETLLEKGFIVYRGGMEAAKKAKLELEAAEREGAESKPTRGRKAKVEE